MPDLELKRMAAPTSWSAESKTATVVLSTDREVGDGYRLLHTREAIRWPERPLPVVLDHLAVVDAVIGAVTDLQLERQADSSTALVGRVVLDGPAAPRAEPLLRTGAARWSVGARIHKTARDASGAELVSSWSPTHLALVVEAQDPASITRNHAMTSQTSETAHQSTESDADAQLTPAELRRQRDVLAIARAAQLSDEEADTLLRSGRPARDCSIEAVRLLRQRLEGSVVLGHPAQGPGILPIGSSMGYLDRAGCSAPAGSTGADGEPADPLAKAIHRAFAGKPQDRPITEVLKDAGYVGRNPDELVRSAFVTGKRSASLIRGYHSTSDAQALLIETGDRRLQERQQEAPRGILELARTRVLTDFREVSVIDAGLVGGAVQLNEGAEIKYGSLESEAGKYKASRYGLGLSFSYEALRGDDLGGIAQVLDEVSATMLEAEAAKLGELLHGDGGLGGTCPDNKALFHADHNNKPGSAASLDVTGLSTMVQLLRGQTSVGGRRLWLQPGYLLCGPDLEASALQLLSETWEATAPDDTNPWKSLKLIVDPTVEATYFYLAAAGSRKPFELGRVAGLPAMKQEENFNTSGLRMKVEHGFGAACIDHRVIVRNK